MGDFNLADCLTLAVSLQKFAQQDANPDLARAIAIKRLQAIVGADPSKGVASQSDSALKTSDLSNMDSLLAFLKTNNISYGGVPIISTSKRPGDEFWNNNYISPPALKGYLDHLSGEIGDRPNSPLAQRLHSIITNVNQMIGIDYKPQDKTQPAKPGQPQESKQPDSSQEDLNNIALPLNPDSIDFIRINKWLMSFNQKAAPQYKPQIERVINDLNWLKDSTTSGWTPINLDGPADTIYTNVRDFWLHKDQRVAYSMPSVYLTKLAQFIGDIGGLLSAFHSQGLDFGREDFNQQFEFLKLAQIRITSWISSLHGVQERIDGVKH
jgi:hypothetical protein